MISPEGIEKTNLKQIDTRCESGKGNDTEVDFTIIDECNLIPGVRIGVMTKTFPSDDETLLVTGKDQDLGEYCIGEVCSEWATITVEPDDVDGDPQNFCQECHSSFIRDNETDTDETDTDETDTDETDTEETDKEETLSVSAFPAEYIGLTEPTGVLELADTCDTEPEEYLSSTRHAPPDFGVCVREARSSHPDMGVKRLLKYIRKKWPLTEGGSKEIRDFDRGVTDHHNSIDPARVNADATEEVACEERRTEVRSDLEELNEIIRNDAKNYPKQKPNDREYLDFALNVSSSDLEDYGESNNSLGDIAAMIYKDYDF